MQSLILTVPDLTVEPVSAESAAVLSPVFAAMEPWKRLGYRAETLEGYFTRNDPALQRFALRRRDGWIGLVAVRSPWLRGPFIEFLGLVPDARGRGTGKAVLAAIETAALAGNARFLWVSASGANTDALRFYEKSGFREVFCLDGLIREGEDERFLQKRLKPTAAPG